MNQPLLLSSAAKSLPEAVRIRCLNIQFEGRLARHEIPAFRGALAGTMKDHSLFHNHRADGIPMYRYPLIQYKVQNGRAAMQCFEDGVDAAQIYLSKGIRSLRINGRELETEVRRMDLKRWMLRTWDQLFHYRIHQWIAATGEGFSDFVLAPTYIEKVKVLERRLVNQLVLAARGLGCQPVAPVKASITWLSGPKPFVFKETRLHVFHATFTTNLCLPEYTGIGKGAAWGLGVIERERRAGDED